MKKTALIILSTLMLIGIFGCGTEDKDKTKNNNMNNMDHSKMSNMDHSNMNMDNNSNKK